MGLLLVLVRIELVRQNWTNSARGAWTIVPCLECLRDDLGDCDTTANTGRPAMPSAQRDGSFDAIRRGSDRTECVPLSRRHAISSCSMISKCASHYNNRPALRVSRTFGFSPAPGFKKFNQQPVHLLGLLLMREMTALFDRFSTEIVCHLGPDGRHIEHLADRLKIGTPKRQYRARDLCLCIYTTNSQYG
jgi:hypothetical protein